MLTKISVFLYLTSSNWLLILYIGHTEKTTNREREVRFFFLKEKINMKEATLSFKK